jgi:hypothetical protein
MIEKKVISGCKESDLNARKGNIQEQISRSECRKYSRTNCKI